MALTCCRLPLALAQLTGLTTLFFGKVARIWQSVPETGNSRWTKNRANAGSLIFTKIQQEGVNLLNEKPEIAERLWRLIERHSKEDMLLYPAATSWAVMIDKSLAEQYTEGDEIVYWAN